MSIRHQGLSCTAQCMHFTCLQQNALEPRSCQRCLQWNMLASVCMARAANQSPELVLADHGLQIKVQS